MKAPNMETITKSLEKSLKNVSLSEGRRRRRRSEKKEESNEHVPSQITETTLELNSHLSLPSHWEQCLDLKTGEIYYINWKNGMRVKEDPRKVMMNVDNNNNEDSSGESYGTLCSEEDSSYYDSEESSSESSPSSREYYKQEVQEVQEVQEEEEEEEEVLVVAGCKVCFMYLMVPKLVEDCPKCASQLLHFDQSSHYN